MEDQAIRSGGLNRIKMASSALRDRRLKIGIISLQSFLKDLPEFFVRQGASIDHNAEKATTFSHTDELFLKSQSQVIEVKTLGEFEELKQRLLNLPMYILVRLGRHSINSSIEGPSSDSHVMFVNTRHAEVAHLLRPKFDEAESAFRNGKSFCLEIDFNPALMKWLKSYKPGGHSTDYYVEGAKFYVTNYTKPIELASDYSALSMCLCRVFIRPPYFAYRFVVCNDIKVNVFLTVQLLNPNPDQSNEPDNVQQVNDEDILRQPPFNPYTPPPPYTSFIPGAVSEE